MSSSFLDLLERHPSARREAEEGCGGPAAQGHRPEQGVGGETRWAFAFSTGIECSNPTIAGPDGRSLRRDLLEECGHYRLWREDLQLVKDLGIP